MGDVGDVDRRLLLDDAAGWPALGLGVALDMLTPCTTTRFSARSTRSTSPLLPLSRPVITTTLSPFLILNLAMSEHLGRERDDLHELACARSSRVTGPKMRVPIGSPCLLISTAALRSKRMALPSGRRISLAVRTITA